MPTPRSNTNGNSRVIEGGGLRWEVREGSYSDQNAHATACLIFENEFVIRRVRVFPPDWLTCSDEDLYALSLVF